jgi:DNA-binding PadR family transcriptional regulator
MRTIEQRTGSAYTPSPGVVYPTLQLLEDMGHVRAREGGERKVYELTDAGRQQLERDEQRWRAVTLAVGQLLEEI